MPPRGLNVVAIGGGAYMNPKQEFTGAPIANNILPEGATDQGLKSSEAFGDFAYINHIGPAAILTPAAFLSPINSSYFYF